MPRTPILPEVPVDDKHFLKLSELLGEYARRRCEPDADFHAVSQAERAVMSELMWHREDLRLAAEVTTAEQISVDGEDYAALAQPSAVVVYGLWGAHRIDEPLYRLVGVHNGPTLKPLARRLGLLCGKMLPEFASLAGALMSSMTDREAHATLQRAGVRVPSRAAFANLMSHLLSDLASDPRELEEASRRSDELDFEVAAISCGMDRLAVRMDEELEDGPVRDAKLREQAKRSYQRTPPEPFECNWRMAYSANVTAYDEHGVARRTFRYGQPADRDGTWLAARAVDDVNWLLTQSPHAVVACIQDGALELDVLRRELEQRLPQHVRREHIVDFHHAISYLDKAVQQCEENGDPHSIRRWYRDKLLHEPDGVTHVIAQLQRRQTRLAAGTAAWTANRDALRYVSRRRAMMGYAQLRRANLPIGSGATESGCALLQLRIKHPGSHWRSRGLRGVMAARGLMLSDRWDSAIQHRHMQARAEVLVA